MLTITVPGIEHFDEKDNKFVSIGDFELELEHSLVSLSKWESIWEKSFFDIKEKTYEETVSYVECMILTPKVPSGVLARMSEENYAQVNEYVTKNMTATWFAEEPKLPGGRLKREVVTSELIYYWMIALNIPFECQHWHLNRLLTLIQVVNKKNSPPKKMPRSEVQARQRALNQQRREQARSKG